MSARNDLIAGPVTTPFPAAIFWAALIAILLLGLALRSIDVHNPVMDHPAWRQGDTAAIARNFAQLNFNILYPQTDYDGPPPNYVQLELQIVPYLAAIGYKIFGVHEIFGRAISIAFSLGTVAILAFFGRWLFVSDAAGLGAALLYAILPGSVYYGRTFMPDTAMTFFLTAAVFATARTVLERRQSAIPRRELASAILLAIAFLAKPVSLVAVIPLLALDLFAAPPRLRTPWRSAAMMLPGIVAVWLYLRYLGSHAEWQWATAITKLHVIPSLTHALTSPHAFAAKLTLLLTTIPGMLATTMLGPAAFGIALVAFLTPLRSRSDALLYGWLASIALYAFVVVTVERVDYYLYPALPLAALAGGALLARLTTRHIAPSSRSAWVFAAGAAIALLVTVGSNEAQIRPYYRYRHEVYAQAHRLSTTLAPGALVVMAHYDPSILYYMRHKGWEEDPLLWTPFDEESAIKKGARYFIAVEDNRFRRNAELFAWMQRFPLLPDAGIWPVYETDNAKILPGAEQRWQDFRRKEKARNASGQRQK